MNEDIRNGTLGVAAALVAVLSIGGALLIGIRGELAPVPLFGALVALLAMPFVVIALCAVQRPGIATLGQAGAIAFAFACLFGAFVVLYALVAGVDDIAGLRADLGGSVWAAQAALVPGGVAFGAASYVRGRLPRWACGSFVLGLLFVIPTLGTPAGFQLVVLGLVDLGLFGMGMALIPLPSPHRRPSSRPAEVERGRGAARRPPGTRSVASGV